MQEFIASSYSTARKVVRASLPVWLLVSEEVFALSYLSPVYFVCLLVCFPLQERLDLIRIRLVVETLV